jgi:hypothetical protein
MDIHRSPIERKQIIAISFFLALLGLSIGTQAQTQQRPRLSPRYAKAALSSLFAIESDSSSPRDEDSETAEVITTRAIDAADKAAVTDQEKSITEVLRQVYQLKLHDNGVIGAYRKLMEIENAPANDETVDTRNEKDYAVGQFADGEAAVMDREEPCLRQLEQSLLERSPKEMTACVAWIHKAGSEKQ